MSLTLKVDGRTKRGLAWKELIACGKPANQGAIVSNKICSNCNITPDFDKQVIKCMKCNLSFHVDCLLMPITEEYVKHISENPSMWWVCLSCVSAKSSDGPVNTHNEVSHNSATYDIVLQNSLSKFKKEMLTLVSETIDQKFKTSADTAKITKHNGEISQPDHDANYNVNWPTSHTVASKRNDTNTTGLPNPAVLNSTERHVLLLDPKDDNDVKKDNSFNKETISNVNKAIHGINVNFCKVKSSGVVALGF